MIYIIIPSYNDSSNFDKLFKNLKNILKTKKYKIIVIDDGSTDDTINILEKLSKKYQVNRIGYNKNRGPGYAFAFGFKFILKKLRNKDLVITIEADNTSDYKILNKMISLANRYDAILASPNIEGGKFLGISNTRRFLSNTANILDSLIFGVDIKTFSSFYRVYTGEIINKLSKKYGNKIITDHGFSSVVELIIKLKNIEAKMIEIPAVVDWRQRKGKSKMSINKTILGRLFIYFKFIKGKYN